MSSAPYRTGWAGQPPAHVEDHRRNGNAAAHWYGCLVPRAGDGHHHRARRRAERARPQYCFRAADPGPAHRGDGRTAAAGARAAAQAAERAVRPRPALLGRRRGLRHRVPRPRDRAAAPGFRRPAGRAGQPAARPPARPQPPAVGDLPDHRAGAEPCRGLHQDPPRRDRRGLRRRAADRPVRPHPGGPRAAPGQAVPAGKPAAPAGPGRQGGRAAGLAPGADRADHQRAGEAPAHPGPGGEHAGRRACSG